MKAHRLTIRTHPLKTPPGKLDLADMLEEVILAAPPGGATTEQIVKGAAAYLRLAEERKKNDGATEWIWWIDSETHRTLLAQLDLMRWGQTPGEIRLLVVDFVRAIREAKEEEVPIASAPEPGCNGIPVVLGGGGLSDLVRSTGGGGGGRRVDTLQKV